MLLHLPFLFFFFFNDTATTEIYTLSLHDALPISASPTCHVISSLSHGLIRTASPFPDRKSTRLNSSHSQISYAVFCLKKKKKNKLKPAIHRTQHSFTDTTHSRHPARTIRSRLHIY